MTATLVQKHPTKGSREFQIIDNELQYTIQTELETYSLSVLLDILEADPVISGSMLAFVSKGNKEPLVELFLDLPNKEAFDEFVENIRQKIIKVQQEIKENDFGRFRVTDEGLNVNLARLNESIELLQKNVDPKEIDLLLSALIELKTKPSDIQCQKKVAERFNELGFAQGQVVFHAPYLNVLFFGNSYIA